MCNPYCDDSEIPDVNEKNPSSVPTIFEIARIIGQRAIDISEGADSDMAGNEVCVKYAKKEVISKKCPRVVIKRYFPDGSVENIPYPS